MSNKERAIQLINSIPEPKLAYVINMLEILQGYAGEAIEPDEWDLAMIAEAKAINDGSTISLSELEKELGLDV